MSAGTPRSAYGLTFLGLDAVDALEPALGDGPSAVRVSVSSDASAVPPLRPLDADHGVRRLADGRVLELRRCERRAVFHGPPLDPELLAHPYLAPVATAFSRWHGREAYHAGAFVVGGRAYAVLGPRTAGKSTLLAALAARGRQVLSDDIMVTDGEQAFAGPRCVDLRQPWPSDELDCRPTRTDTRWRVRLPSVATRLALGGWVFLDWGDQAVVEPVRGADLIARLAVRRAWRTLPSDPLALLALAGRPAWTFRRPQDWSVMGEGIDLLLARLDAAAAVELAEAR